MTLVVHKGRTATNKGLHQGPRLIWTDNSGEFLSPGRRSGVEMKKFVIAAIAAAALAGCASEYSTQAALICESRFPDVSSGKCIKAIEDDMARQDAGKQSVLQSYLGR